MYIKYNYIEINLLIKDIYVSLKVCKKRKI